MNVKRALVASYLTCTSLVASYYLSVHYFVASYFNSPCAFATLGEILPGCLRQLRSCLGRRDCSRRGNKMPANGDENLRNAISHSDGAE